MADLAIEPAGVALLTAVFRDPAFWKRYRGGTAGRLWTRPAGGQTGQPEFTRILAGLAGQLASPMLVGGRLAFLSDHEGTGNLYSCTLDGGDLRRHTDHDGRYARNASTDGQRIVYHCAGDIWLLDGLDAPDGPRRLEISLGSPAARAPRLISAEDHLDGLSCDHSGQASAIEVRGTVHWLTHRDGPARALSVVPGVRARLPRVLGQTGQVAWVTDAEGADAIDIAPSDGSAAGTPPRRLAAGAIGWVADLAAAPDGSAIAVAARDGRLLIVDTSSGAVTELASSRNGEVTGLAWSPDSAWLAWSHPGPEQLRHLRMVRPADPGRTVVDVTDARFTDTDPVFTADGKYLAFLSVRSFDPVYDAHVFDLSFPYGCRPYLVPLAAATPSPFAPLPGGRPVGGRSEDDATGPPGAAEGSRADDGPAAGDGERQDAPPPVVVDTDGLAGRIVQIPVVESRYSSLRAVKGGLAWLKEPVIGSLGDGGPQPGDAPPRPSLEHFDLESQRCTELADELDWFEASGDGSVLVVSDHGKLTVVPASRKADPDNPADRVEVDKSRARYLADPAALWRNAYAEAGRFIRHDFWVADLAEVDWDGALELYRPLLDRIAGPGTSPTCCGSCSASSAPRTRTSCRPTTSMTTPSRGWACSERTWSAAPTGAGRWAGCCPASLPTPRPAPRSPPRARRSARATRCSRWTGSCSTGPGRARCWWARPASRWSSPSPRPRAARPAAPWWSRSPRSGGCATRTGSPGDGSGSGNSATGGSATCTSRTWSARAGRISTATCARKWSARD